MIVSSQSKKYVCQTCKNRIPMDVLEECFLAEISAAGLTSADLDARRTEADRKVNELSELIDTHNETIRKVDRDIDTLLELYQNQALDENGFRDRYQKHKERKEELKDELPRLLARRDAIETSVSSAEKAIKETTDILEKWDDLSRVNKRLLIESVLQRVDISEDEIEFTFLYEPTIPPASSNSSNNSNSSTPPNPSLTQRGDAKATQGHGFIAATSWTRAGKVTCAFARATETSPVSSGWRSESSTGRWNSGSSSRNSTPRCAIETSPGFTRRPPPVSAAIEAE